MAGHSKWKNIQARKNAQDSKRGKIFLKLGKEIYVAAKTGGGDPETNASLRLAVDKARTANMPKDNIERAIKKATGTDDNVHYDEITYEGYGPCGVAVMVKVLTDNKNRSATDVRVAFNKNGGNLGESGCVSFMFKRKGLLIAEKSNVQMNEEEMMLEAIEAGAEDIEVHEESYEITTAPENFIEVREALSKLGLIFEMQELIMIPQTTTKLDGENLAKMMQLIETLEDNDDVQEVYHNLEIE